MKLKSLLEHHTEMRERFKGADPDTAFRNLIFEVALLHQKVDYLGAIIVKAIPDDRLEELIEETKGLNESLGAKEIDPLIKYINRNNRRNDKRRGSRPLP